MKLGKVKLCGIFIAMIFVICFGAPGWILFLLAWIGFTIYLFERSAVTKEAIENE